MDPALKRKIVLEEFLRLYSVRIVEYNQITKDEIHGTAIYDSNDPEERQDFCWHMTEENVPSDDSVEIMKIINQNKWCDIDKIIVAEDYLFEITRWSDRARFDKAFDEIFDVYINMVDDGLESDAFFVHM